MAMMIFTNPKIEFIVKIYDSEHGDIQWQGVSDSVNLDYDFELGFGNMELGKCKNISCSSIVSDGLPLKQDNQDIIKYETIIREIEY